MGKRKRSGSFSKSDDPGGAKRSDAEDSQEELDGETAACSTKGATPGGVGTRCSARVQEKQEKLRRESSPCKQILPLEVNCSSSVTGSNVASTVSKGSVKNPSPNNENTLTSNNEVGASSQMGPALEEKRKKRTWELWSIEDKQLFFEALNENGKDFDAIQNYLASKAKSRKSGACGQYAPKNKDQVRHFYYRTWNKISKYLRFPDGMKKANQELYGLINYGELRKKQRILNSKTATKLCELVENGITSIKFRGKTCRIKTPVCRALKRLNGLDDVEHTRVPHKVNVEFIPRDGKTWRSIQSVSQNPRIKIVASLQRTFSSIISYLENKWKRKDDRLKEQFSSVFGKAPTRLRIIPDRRDFNIPLYRVAENTNSATICLRSYKKNVLVCETHDENETSSKIKRKRKQSGGGGGTSGGGGNTVANCSTPVVSAKCLVPFEYPMDPEETSDAESQSALLFPLASEDLQSNFRDDQAYFLAEQSDENALSTKDEIFSRHFKNIEDYTNVFRDIGYPADENQNGEINHLQQTETDNDDVEHELDEAPEEKFPEVEAKPVKTEKFISHLWDEDQVRRGWTAEETGTMTVGEVYLMLGQTEKISFEYFWDGPDSLEDVRTHSLLEKLIMTATLLRKKKTPRSKATTILNASIKCGAQLKCSTCGVKVEIPANLSCSTKTCSASGTASSINAPNTAQPPLLIPRLKSNAPLSTSTTNGKQLSLFPPSQAILSAEPNVALTIPPNMEKLSVSATSSSSCEFTGSKNELSDLDKSLCLSRFIIPKTEPGNNLKDNQMKFQTSETVDEGIPPLNGLSQVSQVNQIYNNSQSCTTLMPYTTQNSSTGNNDNCLIELCSLATNNCNNPNISPNITATLLPPSSCMVRNPSGTVSIVSQQELGQRKNSDSIPRSKTEQITFHRPTTHLRTLEPAKLPPDVEFPPPKPFLDLPKGNRRLGRRPNFKRIVIPRVLPLLPKTPPTTSTVSVMTSLAETVSTTIASSFINVLPVRRLSIIPCAEQQREIVHSTTEAKPTATTITVTPPDNNSPQGINSMKLGYPTDSSQSSSTKPTTPRKAEAAGYEMFMNVAGTLSCNSTDFEDLLKVKRNEGNNNINAGDVDSISLSSFMEISLPESAKMTANEMNIDDLDNSNISLSMIRLEKDTPSKDLITPESSPAKRILIGGPCGSDLMPDFDKTWSMDGGDLSLSNFFHFDSQRSNASETPENEVNFQAILDDGSLDFSSKLLPDVRR